MYTILLTLYVIVAVIIITLIMLQQGKGADSGALGGTGASNTVFGSSGSSTFLSSLTAFFATIFFIGALVIANIVAHQTAVDTNKNVLDSLSQTTTSLPVDVPTVPTTPAEKPSTDPVVPNK